MGNRRFGDDTRAKIFGGYVEFRFENPQGEVDWKTYLNDFEKRMKNLMPVFERWGGYMLESIERTHKAEGRPKKWAALSPKTIKDRIRLGFGASPILDRTGKMRRSYTFEARPRSFTLGNSTKYHKYHQYGTPTIPVRLTIQLLAQDKAQFTRARNKYVETGDIDL